MVAFRTTQAITWLFCPTPPTLEPCITSVHPGMKAWILSASRTSWKAGHLLIYSFLWVFHLLHPRPPPSLFQYTLNDLGRVKRIWLISYVYKFLCFSEFKLMQLKLFSSSTILFVKPSDLTTWIKKELEDRNTGRERNLWYFKKLFYITFK